MVILFPMSSATGNGRVWIDVNDDLIHTIPTKWVLGIRDFTVSHPLIFKADEIPDRYLLWNQRYMDFNNCRATFLYWHKHSTITCKLEELPNG